MVRIVLVIISFLFISSALAQFKKSKGAKDDAALFFVNKRPVTGEEFKYVYRKNNPSKPENYTDAKMQEYFDLLIYFKLKVEEARQRGMDTTATFEKEFKTYHEELKKPFLAEADALEKLARETYERLKEEVKASHILISINGSLPQDTLAAYEKIEAIRKTIMEGDDFAAAARQNSDDPSAKHNGGGLGYFTALQMVFPFEDAAYKLKPGEISRPVRTRFGYHIIKVEDRRPARGEVEVSHILLRANPTAPDQVRNKAFDIFDQLKGGRNWDEVCNEFSDDQSTKSTGGKLRPFGVGAMASAPEFESVAFSLKEPGEISDPFQSQFGWHIIKLERKIPLLPYSELQASLKRKVGRDERLQISKSIMLEKKKKELNFNETGAKARIEALTDSTLTRGKWRYKGEQSFLSEALFSVGGQSISVGRFVDFLQKQQRESSLTPSAYMGELYTNFIQQVVADIEEQRLLKEKPEYRFLLNEYREGILFFSIMEKEVWNKASEDSVGLKQFYEQNKGKFTAGERVEARYFGTDDKGKFTALLGKVSKGDSLTAEDVASFKSTRNFDLFEKGDSKIVDKAPWVTGIHQVEDNGMFYIVEISNLVLPGQKTFEQARAQVIADYQQQLEKQWLDQLRKKYSVEINRREKKKVFAELKANAAS